MNEAFTVPSNIEQVSFSPKPLSDNVQLESLDEKPVPDTCTIVPGGPRCGSRTIDAMLEGINVNVV